MPSARRSATTAWGQKCRERCVVGVLPKRTVENETRGACPGNMRPSSRWVVRQVQVAWAQRSARQIHNPLLLGHFIIFGRGQVRLAMAGRSHHGQGLGDFPPRRTDARGYLRRVVLRPI